MGDAVLSQIVTELLIAEYPGKSEGFLSKRRAQIISRKHLNDVGKNLIPPQQIKYNPHQFSKNIYGNTLEAIVGALYLDKGLAATARFVKKHIYKSVFYEKNTDYKSELQAFAEKTKKTLKYIHEKQLGPDHKKQFFVSVFLENKKISSANSSTKKEAEQAAAKKAINIVF